jgi:hypothetical protein
LPSIGTPKQSRTVTIDRPRQVRFTWSACNRFEETYGKSIPESMSVNIGTRLITHLAWAGLLHAEPALTVRETERRIQVFVDGEDGNIQSLAQELVLALMESGVLGKAKTETPEESPEGNGQVSQGE